jgi:tetratricopeptide (TPR) repeat protein
MARRNRRPGTPAPPPPAKARVPADFDGAFWIFLAVILPLTVLAYQPAWHGGFLWDDNGHITKQTLRSAAGLWRIWFEPGATQQYYPVVHSAFWLQFHAWGVNPTGYHIVNIVLHAVSASLFAVILRRLRVPGWWLAAAVFALHPVQVESVAWITELKNTLSGVFYFAAALTYLRFDERRTRGLYVAALGWFVLALLSKSVTATLPAGLLIVFWWKRGRLDLRRDVLPLAAFFVASVAAGTMTVVMERTFIGASGDAFNFSFVERTLIAGRAVCFYLYSLIWPANLAFNYPRWHVSQAIWWQYLFPLFVGALLVAAWLVRGRTRAPLAALLFFGVTLAPALGYANVYPFRFSFVADHFQYLACAGIFALIAAGLTRGFDRWRAPANVRALAAAAIVLPLVVLTWRDAHGYTSLEALWKTTIERNPEAWLARSNYAAMLLDQQPPDPAQALVHAREAVRIAPKESSARFNLGLALEATGDSNGAAIEYREAIGRASAADRKSARVALVHDRLASVLRAAGRAKDADEEAAIARAMLTEMAGSASQGADAPVDAQMDAAIALLQAGHPDQAVAPLSRLVTQAPHRVDGRFALGVALEQLNQLDRAADEFRAVLAAAPAHGGAAKHLGRVLHSMNRRDEALAAYLQALALDPSSGDLQNDLGVLLAEMGRLPEAEPHFAEAVRLDPADKEAKANLAKVREILKRGKSQSP